MFNIVLTLCCALLYSVSALENSTASVKNANQTGGTVAGSVKNASQSVTEGVTVAAKVTVQTTNPVAVTAAGETGKVTASVPDAQVYSEEELFVGEANKSLTLLCPLESDIKWYKNNQAITGESEHYHVFEGNRSLKVSKIGPDYSGEFLCSNGTVNKTVFLWVKPWVFQPEKKFKNVIEGDPFVMECKAWGLPEVTLNWTVNGQPVVISERIIFKAGSLNTTLRIKHTEYADAGLYVCEAENRFGNATSVMNMNVKDKLAALWPFLGICAEVAILCVIILIFEKRRSKRLEAEESREETDRLNTGNESKVSDELRQRKQ